jgi:NADH:ubiquinone oxidoreductase subunit 3 (subunit A)
MRRKTRAVKKYDYSSREADVLEQDEPYNTGHVKDDIKKSKLASKYGYVITICFFIFEPQGHAA